MDIWVIGAGGLLGSAIVQSASGDHRAFPAQRVPWSRPGESSRALSDNLNDFHRWRRPGEPWAVIWAAGAGVITSSQARLAAEDSVMINFARQMANTHEVDGTFVFASSASVYGNHTSMSCDESSPTAPLNRYAKTKLDQEDELTELFAGSSPLVIARISTLYGPGQNLSKGQGLISSMCRDALAGRAISIFVPLDTQRDYLYTADASRQILWLAERSARCGSASTEIRVLGSYRSTTIGEVARTIQAVARRRPHLLQIQTATSSVHVRRQTLSTTDPALRAMRPTPLITGVGTVYRSLLGRFIAGDR